MNNQNNVFTFCRRFVRVQLAFSEKKRKLANMISLVLPAEADQTAALRAIRGCLSECDHDTEAYEILESLLETTGDCSSEDGIDLDESSEESASDDSDADPDFTPSTPPRTRGIPFYNMYSRKKRKMALSRKPNSGVKRKLVFDESPKQTNEDTCDDRLNDLSCNKAVGKKKSETEIQKKRKREDSSDDSHSKFDPEVPSTSASIFDELESPVIKRQKLMKKEPIIVISDDNSVTRSPEKEADECNEERLKLALDKGDLPQPAIIEDYPKEEDEENPFFDVSDDEIIDILEGGISPLQDITNVSPRADTIINAYFDDPDYPNSP